MESIFALRSSVEISAETITGTGLTKDSLVKLSLRLVNSYELSRLIFGGLWLFDFESIFFSESWVMSLYPARPFI